MGRKTISLPDELEDYIDTKVQSGRYGNDSEYIRDLIRKDQDRDEAVARVQAMVDDALASGISTRSIEEIWQSAKQKAAERQSARARK